MMRFSPNLRITCGSLLLCLLWQGNALANHPDGNLNPPDVANGNNLYKTTCVVCHGANGKGQIPGVPDLRGGDSPLVQKEFDALLRNIEKGYQSPGAMMAMPPKGGNPGLSAQDLLDILGYMRKEFGGGQIEVSGR